MNSFKIIHYVKCNVYLKTFHVTELTKNKNINT